MKHIIRYSTTVAFGYIPLGTAFGLLFTTQTDYSYLYAILMSVFVFAGSAQFLAITILVNQVPLYNVFIVILLINARHIFYGLYTFDIYRKHHIVKRLYLLFSLTDETFSVISTLPAKLQHDTNTALYISTLNHCWWVIGSTIGAILGSTMTFTIPGISFVVTSLFVVLLIEKLHQSHEVFPILCACTAAAISIIFFPKEHFLLGSLLVSTVLFSISKAYARYIRY